MDKQGFYDLLVKSAYDGTFPSITENGSCMYRADKTASCPRRCVVGLLIPDEKYRTDMEGVSVRKFSTSMFNIPEGVTENDLFVLQQLHDSVATKGDWDPEIFVKLINICRIFDKVTQKVV